MIEWESNRLILPLWDFDDPAESRARFETVAAVVRTQIARSHGLAGEFEHAHRVLDETAEVEGEARIRVLLERGRLFRSAGDPSIAAPLFLQAYQQALEHGLAGLAADAAHMLAIALPDEHEQWALRGLAAAEGSDEPLALAMAGALLNNLGWTLADADRWEEAYSLFDQAVAVRAKVAETLGGEAARKSYHVARWARARAARALGHHDAALAELRELAATGIGAADPYVAEEIAANESGPRT
jgi:tetratricopeptide (TPR) repeat protein